MKKIPAILIVLAVSCTFITPFINHKGVELKQCVTPILVGYFDLTEDEQRVMKSAMNFWEDETGIELFLDVGPVDADVGGGVVLVRHGDIKLYFSGVQNPARTRFSSLGQCIGQTVIEMPIPGTYSPELNFAIARHELGHVLGLADTANKYRLMGPRGTMMDHLSDTEIEAIQGVYR